MKCTADTIQEAFFDFTYEYHRTPSRNEIVDLLGAPGSELIKVLGDSSDNLKRTWDLNEKERNMLGQLIIRADKSIHSLTDPICFLPAWCAECKVKNIKGIT